MNNTDGTQVKNLPASAGDTGDLGLIPELGRSPGRGNGNPLLYSCLENSMDRGAWWVTVHDSELREFVMDREAWHAAIHGVAKSRTRLSD